MTTNELARATGIPRSTLILWVEQGWLRPAMTGYGKGSSHFFDEDNAMQAIAISKIKGLFGDGSAARLVIEDTIPQIRRGVAGFRIRDFEVSLT